MKKTTAGMILRISLFVAIALVVYGSYKTGEYSTLLSERKIDFETYQDASLFFKRFNLAIPSFSGIAMLFWFIYTKKDAEGRINVKQETFPEFNHGDEREALLTGKAAKSALAIIIIYTAVILFSYELSLYSIPFMIFATASIPIVGLLAYSISYRYYYSK
ncbi:hypothetical protein [Sporosarcina limicola]|uniref:Signal transduction histidine kinase n=1 Tax=Sporosarcina limicola TaxID=34101 RepID=A0A927MNH5_9BACL|nr:hypothetical protein [Sporosarcina limicola]MBE1554441.1 signal transduction histidine kinase [Sporosarcina limicola]